MEPGLPAAKEGKSLMTLLFYEFCGSALVVYAFNFSYVDSFTRAFAYFMGWMFAVTISGAHFNPATTLAVYLVEGRYRENLS